MISQRIIGSNRLKVVRKHTTIEIKKLKMLDMIMLTRRCIHMEEVLHLSK